jgi:hypothetical protein
MSLKRSLFFAICAAAYFLPMRLHAEDHDFLTPNEVDQVRETQEPNERLQLYLHFAQQRMDLVEHYLVVEKPGRSIFVHTALEDYTQIIEAIDSVSDDALRHKLIIEKGLTAVAKDEKEFLDQLNKIEGSNPKDLGRYKFVLDDAIEATSDSRELAVGDTAKRSAELASSDDEEKKTRESMMSDKERAAKKKSAAQDEEQKKKAPSLYRPGEKPQDAQ